MAEFNCRLGGEVFSFQVAEKEAGESLRQVLAHRGFSEKLITRLKNQGGIIVDGSFHRMIDPVAASQRVDIRWAEPRRKARSAAFCRRRSWLSL